MFLMNFGETQSAYIVKSSEDHKIKQQRKSKNMFSSTPKPFGKPKSQERQAFRFRTATERPQNVAPAPKQKKHLDGPSANHDVSYNHPIFGKNGDPFIGLLGASKQSLQSKIFACLPQQVQDS